MADLAYREVYAMDRVEARKHLGQTYRETGSISKTARLWHTSRQVVRKWVRRAETSMLPRGMGPSTVSLELSKLTLPLA